MNRPAGLTLLAAFSLAVVVTSAYSAAPEPSLVPTQWLLDLKFQDPMPILVSVPGKAEKQLYWYVTYKVINRTGQDRDFVPDFTLYTDTGQVLRDGHGVATGVFDAIQRRLNNPLLLSGVNISGTLLEGEDNAKEGVAIFPDFDAKARQFHLFIGGLSGEIVRIKLPVKVEVAEVDNEGKVQKVLKDSLILRRNLDMTYRVVGEPSQRYTSGSPRRLSEKWVMR